MPGDDFTTSLLFFNPGYYVFSVVCIFIFVAIKIKFKHKNVLVTSNKLIKMDTLINFVKKKQFAL